MTCLPVCAGRVGIWNTATGGCRHSLEGPGGAVEWVDWHPRGDLILAGAEDFTAWLWNAQSGACMQARMVLQNHSPQSTCFHVVCGGTQKANCL